MYSPDISPLSDVCITNVFSLFVTSLRILCGLSQHGGGLRDLDFIKGGWTPPESVLLMTYPQAVTSPSSHQSSKPPSPSQIQGLEGMDFASQWGHAIHIQGGKKLIVAISEQGSILTLHPGAI